MTAVTEGVRDLSMPLASASPVAVPHTPPVRAGARVRVPATLRNHKIGAVVRWFVAQLVADLRGWWVVAANPPSLAEWWAARAPVRLAATNAFLAVAWRVDHWVTGLPLRAVAAGLHLAAGAVAWVGQHPVRRWATFAIVAASVGVAVAYANLTPA